MPPRNERIAAMVLRELGKNPQLTNDVLLEKAATIDRGVRKLEPRQFHATYRLPALRALAPKPAVKAAPKAAAKKATPSAPPSPPPTPPPSPEPAAPAPAAPAPHHGRSSSTALARPHAAEREAVRGILQLVAREALATEDRASFVRLLDSLDERAAVILGLFGRA